MERRYFVSPICTHKPTLLTLTGSAVRLDPCHTPRHGDCSQFGRPQSGRWRILHWPNMDDHSQPSLTDQPSIVVLHVQLLITAQLGHQSTTTTRVIIIMPIAILHNNPVESVRVLLPTLIVHNSRFQCHTAPHLPRDLALRPPDSRSSS